jgi:YVTN family beta-propeller protein
VDITIAPSGTTAYVANWTSGTVTPIATAANTAGSPIKVGAEPATIAITPDSGTAYVVLAAGGADWGGVVPVDTATLTAQKLINIGGQPGGIVISP